MGKSNILYFNRHTHKQTTPSTLPNKTELKHYGGLTAHVYQSPRLNVTLDFHKTPCTYPRRSYLETLHSDAHRVPYLCPTGGHQEFRTLRSS